MLKTYSTSIGAAKMHWLTGSGDGVIDRGEDEDDQDGVLELLDQ